MQKHPVSCKEDPRVVFIKYDLEIELPNGVAPTGFQGACERGTGKKRNYVKKKEKKIIIFLGTRHLCAAFISNAIIGDNGMWTMMELPGNLTKNFNFHSNWV